MPSTVGAAAGPGGKVCGVDLAEKEVLHARRAHAARLTKRHSGGRTLGSKATVIDCRGGSPGVSEP